MSEIIVDAKKRNNEGLDKKAYNHIYNMIMSKKLMPGDKISEISIANDLSISRTPVRSAILKLSEDGIVTVKPNSYAKVTSIDEKTTKDIGFLRLAIDTMAVRLANLYGSNAEFMKLKEIGAKCLEYGEQGKPRKRFEYDIKFHKELAKIGKNKMLYKIQNDLYRRVELIILHDPSVMQSRDISYLEEHVKIADALLDNDVANAVQIAHNHLLSFYGLDKDLPENFL